MGDEIALHNDEAWADDPEHEDDNRWLHRPVMDWAAAERRHDPNSIEGRTFEGLSALGAARRAQLALRGGGETSLLWTHQPHVLAYRRRNARSGILVVLANFSDDAGAVDVSALTAAGLRAPASRMPRSRIPAWWVATSRCCRGGSSGLPSRDDRERCRIGPGERPLAHGEDFGAAEPTSEDRARWRA